MSSFILLLRSHLYKTSSSLDVIRTLINSSSYANGSTAYMRQWCVTCRNKALCELRPKDFAITCLDGDKMSSHSWIV